MQLVFRKFSPGSAPEPAAGEVLLRPHRPEHQHRRDLSCLVLEEGLDAFPHGSHPIQRIVVSDDPTLDDLLAATFLEQCLAGRSSPGGCRAFARYAALVREGLKPGSVPLEVSLEGIYLAIRNEAGSSLADEGAAAPFVAAWSRMAARILQAAVGGVDPFTAPLFSAEADHARGSDFARERAFLGRDHEVYRQDVLRGERWRVHLPEGPPEASGLLLRQPRSLLFKYWSRQDAQAPVGGTYLFLAVDWGKGQWVFSTDPVQRLSLRSLAQALQAAEQSRDAARAEKDPWFDGKPFGHTLVAAPRTGTILDDREVLRLVRRWAGVRTLRPSPFTTRRAVLAGVVIALLAVGVIAWAPWKNRDTSTNLASKDQADLSATESQGGRDRGFGPVKVNPIHEEPQELMLQPQGSQLTFLVENPDPTNRSVRLWVSVRAEPEVPVRSMDVHVNSKGFTPALKREPGLLMSRPVQTDLQPGPNPVVVHLENAGEVKKSLIVKLSWQDNKASMGLHLLAVGVSRYNTPGFVSLPCAADDARDLERVFKEQEGTGLFRKVNCRSVIDEQASKEGILQELEALQGRVNQHDLAIITFSGHGETDKAGQFYFLPYGYDVKKSLRYSGLSWRDLQDCVCQMPCQVFIVMDTCHSGAVLRTGSRGKAELQQMIDRAVEKFASNPRGVVVMAACLGHEHAREDSDCKHGFLTLALLEGITGHYWYKKTTQTPPPGPGILSLKRLDQYVTDRVKELAGAEGQAVVTRPSTDIDLTAIPISAIAEKDAK